MKGSSFFSLHFCHDAKTKQKNLAKMITAQAALLSREFWQASPPVRKNYYCIDGLS